MVGACNPVEVRIAVGPQTCRHVGGTFVDKGFHELLGRSPHIAKMDEIDAMSRPQLSDHLRQLLGHQAKIALA